jgi:hypothetical protein
MSRPGDVDAFDTLSAGKTVRARLSDLEGLARLLVEGIGRIDGGFSLDPDDYIR